MKEKDFVFKCSSKELVILLDIVDSYRSSLLDSLNTLDLDATEIPNYLVIRDISEKLHALL